MINTTSKESSIAYTYLSKIPDLIKNEQLVLQSQTENHFKKLIALKEEQIKQQKELVFYHEIILEVVIIHMFFLLAIIR